MTLESKTKIKRALNFALSVLLSAIFLYIAFHDVNFSIVLTIVSHSSIPFIILFIITNLTAHYVRAVRWKVILHSVKQDASVKNLFGALMVGYGVNCVFPRVGEITRAVLVGKWEGLSRTSMFGTVIVERVIDIIFLGLTVLISVWLYSSSLYESFPWLEMTLYITFLLLAAVILFLFLIIKYKEKFYGLIIRLLSHLSTRFSTKTAYIFEMLTEGFASLKGVKNYTYAILLSIIIMLLYAFNSYVGFFIIGMEKIQPVSFQMGWILMSISAIGVVIPTPGGTGSYHALAKSALVLLFAFTDEIGAAYAFITHIISYFLFIFTALIVFFVLNKQNMNLIKVVETDLKEL